MKSSSNYITFPELWLKYVNIAMVTIGGWLFNFMPYFFMDRNLFLHHYLPSLVFKLITMAALVELFQDLLAASVQWTSIKFVKTHLKTLESVLHLGLLTVISWFFIGFIKLLPLSYGSGSMTADDIRQLKWRESWHLIVHKH